MARNALMDFLQSASNEAAGAISGPVDLLGMGLRGMGVPVPKNALLSSDWMAQRGLTRPVPNGAAQVAGATAGLLSPVAVAAKAPQIAAGLLQAGENALAPRAPGLLSGQRGAIDADEVSRALFERKNQLSSEADDWAARKYKANNRAVAFEGDGPGPEAMRIGSINENRRVKNVVQRDSQIREIEAVLETLKTKPERLEMAYDSALQNAQRMAALDGKSDFSPYLERYLDKAVTGNQNAGFGPGSLGYALRMAVERGKVKPAPIAQPPAAADDFLSQLFGN